MTLTKKILKEDLSVQYGSDCIEKHKKGEELDIINSHPFRFFGIMILPNENVYDLND